MAKIIQARQEDGGMKGENILIMFILSLVTGFVGVPVGAILSGIMQRVLHNDSALVMYGFFLGPIFLGILLGCLYVGKSLDMKNHTRCKKCRGKMHPMTKMDLLFKIPAMGEETYKDAFHYLAENMVKIPSMRAVSKGQRACYVCTYQCERCADRMVRIKDFLPERGSCQDRETYYFDFAEFSLARRQDDLTG